ncbi:hypothetical protein F2981_20280 (plasmid) [Sinorhizobium meliloti]|nr:hypothetical protein [Sinorhizobium meliloti]
MPRVGGGRRISYASSDVFAFQGSLGDNLLYGLKHAPLTEVAYEGDRKLNAGGSLWRRSSPAIRITTEQ